jgi:hypothetical protein
LAGVRRTGKRNRANRAVIGDDRPPHIETETIIAGCSNRAIERGLEGGLAWQAGADRVTIRDSRTCCRGNSKPDGAGNDPMLNLHVSPFCNGWDRDRGPLLCGAETLAAGDFHNRNKLAEISAIWNTQRSYTEG